MIWRLVLVVTTLMFGGFLQQHLAKLTVDNDDKNAGDGKNGVEGIRNTAQGMLILVIQKIIFANSFKLGDIINTMRYAMIY